MILDWVIVMLFVIPPGIIWIVALNVMDFRLRRKGYGALSTFVLVSVVAATPFVTTVTVLVAAWVKNIGIAFLVSGIVSLACGAGLVRVLPQRAPRRRSGRRSLSPIVTVCGGALVLFGALLPVGILVLFIWLGFRARLLWWGFWGSMGAIRVGSYLYHLRRRVEASHEPIPDAPVLYLRPFSEDNEPFMAGPKSKYGSFTRALQSRSSYGDDPIWLTFEDNFNEAVEFLGPPGPWGIRGTASLLTAHRECMRKTRNGRPGAPA